MGTAQLDVTEGLEVDNQCTEELAHRHGSIAIGTALNENNPEIDVVDDAFVLEASQHRPQPLRGARRPSPRRRAAAVPQDTTVPGNPGRWLRSRPLHRTLDADDPCELQLESRGYDV